MKTEKRQIGDWGEETACRVLEKNEYRIIDRNFSCRCGELDIVAVRSGILAFVEVKTRASTDFGLPCQAVNERKKRNIIQTAEFYMKMNPWCKELQPRFDIFEILTLDCGNFYRYLTDVF